MKEFNSIRELVTQAEAHHCPISRIVIDNQMNYLKKTEDELHLQMDEHLQVMWEAYQNGYQEMKSPSGLSGGMAKKYHQSTVSGKLLSPLTKEAITIALSISEYNACMGRIVAAPTAGSCGILPAVLFSVSNTFQLERKKTLDALFHSAGVCMVIAKNASISGAEGGCQAECGSAAAAAASAAVELMGGTPEMSAHACALALKFVMGLVCDPVAGLVEVPCVKRNASGAVNALTAAELALSGIESAIPVDEVIEAMKNVGTMMPCALKETAQGGLAATKTARKISERVHGR
ncbi:L-serine ammonia-lyase, iron-sulfur-dependent, subunit alpha [Acetivibrio sp. MSJd-27]|uniref:L-serine ammonia-lyase, iron-sulfur-dependent, subunit alpha n=1 Tax=Acetivibrio sp. MSJd-27 TaxID=2841523 RepID=UPI001C1169B4|nr:L-serine ammonia-lyase, iron-sulfur-dependent, subunit alpha [Acetivibrio sp. MSJd-27]MBU5450626.1 L-serine ammonia-lyase, iron-sulfur-dependent, subunit alpha [Acetivibrio sp. MSJd-27]